MRQEVNVTRRDHRPSPTEPALDQQMIVQAALDLLDEVGLDHLSMRRLADRLGIKAASLYWHIRDKDHLLSLLADAICAAMRSPDPTLPWRQQSEALLHESRRALLAHRDGARIMASTLPAGPNRLRLIEQGMSVLLDAGFSPRDAAYVGFLMNDYVTMFVVEETRFSETQGAESQPLDLDWTAALPPDEYPTLHKLAEYWMADNADERFQFGLEILMDGIEERLKK